MRKVILYAVKYYKKQISHALPLSHCGPILVQEPRNSKQHRALSNLFDLTTILMNPECCGDPTGQLN
jgi:hypothetical protein